MDYLLVDENVSVEAVIAVETNEKMECSINSYLKKIRGVKVPVNGFGTSDCRKNCRSHLLYFPEGEKADCLVQEFVEQLQSASGTLSVVVVD